MTITLDVLAGFGVVFLILLILASLSRRQYAWTQLDTIQSGINSAASPYWYRVLRATDVWLNVWLNGLEGITLSSRIAVMVAHLHASNPAGWFVTKWLRFLDWLQADHGKQAMSGDIARAKVVIAELTPVLAMQTT